MNHIKGLVELEPQASLNRTLELGLFRSRGLEGRSGALQYKLNKTYEISVM